MPPSKNADKIYYYYSIAAHPMFFSIVMLAALFLKPISSSALGPLGELIAGILFFAALPLAVVYKPLKRKEITLNFEEQQKRGKFFLPWATIFFAAFLLYSFFNAKTHAALALSFAAVMVFLFFANKKSKISWHTTGLSSMITALAYSYGSALLILYAVLIPTISVARYKLKAHNLFELAVGAVAGSAITYACFLVAGTPATG